MNKKGFAGIGLIIAIVFAGAAIGGGVYFFVKNKPSVITPPVQSTIPSDWKTYSDTTYGYQVNYPSSYSFSSGKVAFSSGTGYSEYSLPSNSFPFTNFKSAILIIKTSTESQSVQNCSDINEYFFPTDNITVKNMTIVINGINFSKTAGTNSVGGGANSVAKEIYSTVHNNICYQADLSVYFSNVGHEGAEIKAHIIAQAQSYMMQILNTFKFTN